jgi:hypothetical protein
VLPHHLFQRQASFRSHSSRNNNGGGGGGGGGGGCGGSEGNDEGKNSSSGGAGALHDTLFDMLCAQMQVGVAVRC